MTKSSFSRRGSGTSGESPSRPRGKLILLVVLCIAPVIASYLAYYVFPPSGRTNYGVLIEPQRVLPPIASTTLQLGALETANGADGAAGSEPGLERFRGRWVLLAIGSGACPPTCAEKLFFVRQTQTAMGRERERVAQVLLVTDRSELPVALLDAHPEMTVLRVAAPGRLQALFPVAEGESLGDHLYLIDPMHHLMMRFPKSPDPAKVRKDLMKLLKASRIG